MFIVRCAPDCIDDASLDSGTGPGVGAEGAGGAGAGI